MKLIYNVNEKPKLSQNIVFALQQIVAIMAATLLVPILVTSAGLNCDPAAALFGAGIGTLVYLLVTRFKSPVFLGSSFTFLGALIAVAQQNYGYWGLILGVTFAGIVYLIIALIIKFVGSNWINKLLPPLIIGPVLTIIGLSLAGTATGWISSNGGNVYNLWAVLCGIVTFLIIVLASNKGTKNMKLFPFIIGIGAGFILALIITGFGYINDSTFCQNMRIVDFSYLVNCFSPIKITSFFRLPEFTIIKAFQSTDYVLNWAAVGNIALLFVPVAIVELAQHISDHKNLSNIIGNDLLQNPGLHKTLIGDGLGSIAGSVFCGCANTTYGESIGCVALTKNASTSTILLSSIGCMLISFISPFVALINTLPKCVVGGACIALYGFIAVSGLQMLREVDLSDNRNLYPVAAILVIGVGGLTLNFGHNNLTNGPMVQISSLVVAMFVGIIVNLITHSGKDKMVSEDAPSASMTDSKETENPIVKEDNTTIKNQDTKQNVKSKKSNSNTKDNNDISSQNLSSTNSITEDTSNDSNNKKRNTKKSSTAKSNNKD